MKLKLLRHAPSLLLSSALLRLAGALLLVAALWCAVAWALGGDT